MSDSVTDASSILALLRDEPGANLVHRALIDGEVFVSSVNVVEVLTKLMDRGAIYGDAVAALDELKLICVDFTKEHAQRAAALRTTTRRFGLSLGDRACLALAIELQLPVLTADQAWSQIDLPWRSSSPAERVPFVPDFTIWWICGRGFCGSSLSLMHKIILPLLMPAPI